MSMERKGLSAPDPSKVTVLTSDLSHPDFGLRTEDYHDITSLITHIVHCAWPVNFQLGIRSFEPHIAGVCNLVNLSLAVRTAQPARFIFCSSITSAMGRLAPARITEAPITDLAFSSSLGYGRSKLVAEHVIQRAVETAHANAIILRIGQVVGDQKHGSWSQDEMIPMIVRSGLMMSSLPSLDMKCEWLPVDTLAETVLELSGLQVPLPLEPREDAKQSDPRRISGDMKACGLGKDNSQAQGLVYNVRSPHTFSWTDDFLPTLAGLGFKFDSVPFTQWLNHLQSLQEDPKEVSNNGSAGSGSLAIDPSHNPAIKLIEYLRNGFHDDSRYTVFEITEAQRRSAALRNAPMVVQSGLVGLMVKRWVSDWTMTDGRVLN